MLLPLLLLLPSFVPRLLLSGRSAGTGRSTGVEAHCGARGPAGTGRRRPSAAEFMARITVDVVTHLDLAAGAKSGSRRATRPDAADYEGEDGKAVGHRRGGGVEAEDGAPAGRGETDVPAEGLAKMTQPMFEVPPEAVRSVAFYEERQAAPMMMKYKREFEEGFGRSCKPTPGTGPGSGVADYDAAPLDSSVFADALRQQGQRFDFKREEKTKQDGEIVINN